MIKRKHMVLPDAHTKEGVPLDHLKAAGNYAVEKKPDVIICLGDFADMPSLSSYDKGKKSFEGRRYTKDINAATEAMDLFLTPIEKEVNRLKDNKKKLWVPDLYMLLGNHEDRIDRAIESDAMLEGLISTSDLPYDDWTVVPYNEPIVIDGICYSHYFTSGVMGRAVSSARALTTKKHMSCVMGHVQRKEVDIQYRADGKRLTSIFAGTFYQQDEKYLGHQGNAEAWKGLWMLHEVEDGQFYEMPVSLNYLLKEYL